MNKFRKRIVFKIKTGYKVELLSSETMELLGGTKKDVDQDKDGEDVPKLESVEVVLVHCNNNNFQQLSITIINKHKKYCLLLYLINNLVN